MHETWKSVKKSVTSENAEGKKILRYLTGKPSGSKGFTLTKQAMCDKLQIDTGAFDALFQASHIPRAISKAFGEGGILFCGNTLHGYVSMPHNQQLLIIY